MAKIITSSNRLILEELSQQHFPDLCTLLASPKVQKYFKKTLNLEETQDFLNKSMKRQQKDGYSFWAVVRKNDGVFIGICGLLAQLVDDFQELEVGYRINDKYWGEGYATEAALACMKYAKDKSLAKSIISCILPENIASVRVAQKNGMHREKQSLFHGYLVDVYRKEF